jgi:hypothetical protein
VADAFDPLRVFDALEQARVAYVVVGELAEILRGSGGLTDEIEIVPNLRADNVARLRKALASLDVDGRTISDLIDGLQPGGAPAAFSTPLGRLVVTPTPPGTRGWDDLRRGAQREPLGGGVRPPIADLADLVRINEVANEPERSVRAARLRRMIELQRDLTLDR